MKSICIIRNLDCTVETVGPMECDKALLRAESGKLFDNWSLEECVENPIYTAAVLRVLIRQNQGKRDYILVDETFKSFFQNIKQPQPESVFLDSLLEKERLTSS